jgi:hypothetical protein
MTKLDWTTVLAEARQLREQSEALCQSVKATIEEARRAVDASVARKFLRRGRGQWPPRSG